MNANTSAILRERAVALARKPPPAPAPEPQLAVIEFGIGRNRYALAAGVVRAVVNLKEITPLPGVPAFVRGVVNVRGDILAAIDLGRLLGLAESGAFGQIIVVQHGDAEFGVLAGETVGWQSVPVSGLAASPAALVKGVTKQGVAVLDEAKLVEAVSIGETGVSHS
jgi:purine-binding chemotaxis protein CheW